MKTDSTKQKIQDAFFSLAATLPASKISVSKICETCRISRGTFYLHYDNVEDFLSSVENELLYELEKVFKKYSRHSFQDESNHLLLETLEYAQKKKREFLFLTSQPAPCDFTARLDALLQQSMVHHLNQLGISAENQKLAIAFTCSGLRNLLIEQLQEPGLQPTQHISEEYKRLMDTIFAN